VFMLKGIFFYKMYLELHVPATEVISQPRRSNLLELWCIWLCSSFGPAGRSKKRTLKYFQKRPKHPVFQIWGFLGLPDPDPSIINQNSKKILDFYCFVTSL
jgi:hypothetical protein